MRKNEWIDFAIALLAGVVFVCIAAASEPPQCNLPGWPTVKDSLTVHSENCRCGVACECADVFTVTHKAHTATKPAKTPPAKSQRPSQAVEKRYKRIGRKWFVEDVLVEVAQPASAAYTLPTSNATYQNRKMDCSSGTCRYIR